MILIAVSLKEDEILQQLQDLDIHNLEIISFLDENSPITQLIFWAHAI